MISPTAPDSGTVETPAILQVDDNTDDRLLFQVAWEKTYGENPLFFADSKQEATDYLEGRGKFSDRKKFPIPSLIIVDMRLPDGSAIDLLRWIRADPKLNKLIIIVWSGSAHEEDVKEAYRSGANSFLLKSANPRHLQDTVGLIRSYWLHQNLVPAEVYQAAGRLTHPSV